MGEDHTERARLLFLQRGCFGAEPVQYGTQTRAIEMRQKGLPKAPKRAGLAASHGRKSPTGPNVVENIPRQELLKGHTDFTSPLRPRPFRARQAYR